MNNHGASGQLSGESKYLLALEKKSLGRVLCFFGDHGT